MPKHKGRRRGSHKQQLDKPRSGCVLRTSRGPAPGNAWKSQTPPGKTDLKRSYSANGGESSLDSPLPKLGDFLKLGDGAYSSARGREGGSSAEELFYKSPRGQRDVKPPAPMVFPKFFGKRGSPPRRHKNSDHDGAVGSKPMTSVHPTRKTYNKFGGGNKPPKTKPQHKETASVDISASNAQDGPTMAEKLFHPTGQPDAEHSLLQRQSQHPVPPAPTSPNNHAGLPPQEVSPNTAAPEQAPEDEEAKVPEEDSLLAPGMKRSSSVPPVVGGAPDPEGLPAIMEQFLVDHVHPDDCPLVRAELLESLHGHNLSPEDAHQLVRQAEKMVQGSQLVGRALSPLPVPTAQEADAFAWHMFTKDKRGTVEHFLQYPMVDVWMPKRGYRKFDWRPLVALQLFLATCQLLARPGRENHHYHKRLGDHGMDYDGVFEYLSDHNGAVRGLAVTPMRCAIGGSEWREKLLLLVTVWSKPPLSGDWRQYMSFKIFDDVDNVHKRVAHGRAFEKKWPVAEYRKWYNRAQWV